MSDLDLSPIPRVLLVAKPLRRAELALQLTQHGARIVRATSADDVEMHLASGDFIGLLVDVAERADGGLARVDWAEADALRDAIACAYGWPVVARAASVDAATWVHSLRSQEDATLCVPEIDGGVVDWLSAARSPRPRLVGASAGARAMLAELGHAARARDSVLVTGEPGAGKLLAARKLVERISGSSVLVECARWSPATRFDPAQVVGSLRQTAVLVLKRLDALPAEHARAFAGWIDRLVERQAAGAVRIVATCDLGPDQGALVERLGARTFFRLDRSRVEVPPLRDRMEDIPLLLRELARRLGAELRLTATEQATLARVRYDWPGNVQELRSVLARAIDDVQRGAPVALQRNGETELLGAVVVRRFVQHLVATAGAGVWGRSLRFTRQVRERELVRALTAATLDAVGDVAMTAALLGCHETTVRAAMRVRIDAESGSEEEVDAAHRAATDAKPESSDIWHRQIDP